MVSGFGLPTVAGRGLLAAERASAGLAARLRLGSALAFVKYYLRQVRDETGGICRRRRLVSLWIPTLSVASGYKLEEQMENMQLIHIPR